MSERQTPREEHLHDDRRWPGEGAIRSDVVLPRFNWGAFFLAPIWGLAHGQWPAVLLLPAWVFVDNMIRRGGAESVVATVAGWGMFAVTVGLQAAFALNANRVAYARVADRMTVGEYERRQRWWAIAGVIVAVAGALWIGLFLARS